MFKNKDMFLVRHSFLPSETILVHNFKKLYVGYSLKQGIADIRYFNFNHVVPVSLLGAGATACTTLTMVISSSGAALH